MLTVTGAKGGTGKSTTAVALAAELTAGGYRVALRDLDTQASATLALGHDPVSDPWDAPAVEAAGGVQLYRGGRALGAATEAEARAHLDAAAHSGVEVLVLDCPPHLDALALAALEVATLALVPLRPSAMDLPSWRDVAALVEGLDGGPRLRAVLTQVHARRLLTRDVFEYFDTHAPGALYGAQIPEDVRAAEAPGYALPVGLYAPNSRAAEAYRALALEVAHDLNGRAARRAGI